MKHVLFLMLVVCGCSLPGCTARVWEESTVTRDRDSREVRPGDTREECLRSIKKARLDARGGIYRMYVFGRERYDARFVRFLGEYLLRKYGIELVMSGRDDPDRDRCYSNEMDKIIFNTFGPDVLARAEQEAREMFGSGR